MIAVLVLAVPIRVVPPPLPKATWAPTITMSITKRSIPFDGGDSAAVGGRRIHFKADVGGYDHVNVKAVGRDGTVLIDRGAVEGQVWTLNDFIVHGGRETMVRAFGNPAYADDYVDAHHYLASYYRPGDNDGMRPPSFPPMIVVMDGPKHRLVGQGDPVSWALGHEVVATVPIDAKGDIAYQEDESMTHTRVFENGKTYDLGELAFRLRLPNGTSVFFDGSGGLWTWERGGLRPWARLPLGWEPWTGDAKGDLLLRGENGEAGLLRGTALRPLRLDPLTRKAIGDGDPRWVRPDGSFAFSTSGIGPSGHDETTLYIVTPKR